MQEIVSVALEVLQPVPVIFLFETWIRLFAALERAIILSRHADGTIWPPCGLVWDEWPPTYNASTDAPVIFIFFLRFRSIRQEFRLPASEDVYQFCHCYRERFQHSHHELAGGIIIEPRFYMQVCPRDTLPGHFRLDKIPVVSYSSLAFFT